MTKLNWQALLFVPAGAPRFVASAIRHRPDAVILDLEDAVAPSDKAKAREALRGHQQELAAAGIPVVLRVNSSLAAMVRDIAAADMDHLAAVMVPKCSNTRGLENAAELLDAEPPVPLIALIEQPSALPRVNAIASVPRVAGLMFGPEDYAAGLGTEPSSPALEIAAALVTAACAERGLLPIGIAGAMGNFKDKPAYLEKVKRARLLGFRAAAAIHPDQLPLLRAGFMPSPDEVAKAQAIVATFEAAQRGAVAHEGAMLDEPIVEQARRLLGRVAGHAKD